MTREIRPMLNVFKSARRRQVYDVLVNRLERATREVPRAYSPGMYHSDFWSLHRDADEFVRKAGSGESEVSVIQRMLIDYDAVYISTLTASLGRQFDLLATGTPALDRLRKLLFEADCLVRVVEGVETLSPVVAVQVGVWRKDLDGRYREVLVYCVGQMQESLAQRVYSPRIELLPQEKILILNAARARSRRYLRTVDQTLAVYDKASRLSHPLEGRSLVELQRLIRKSRVAFAQYGVEPEEVLAGDAHVLAFVLLSG